MYNNYNDMNNNNTNNNITTITKNKFVIFTTLVQCTVWFELEVTSVQASLYLWLSSETAKAHFPLELD